MKLFIANTTKQVQEIWYRLPERERAMKQIIPIGSQLMLFKDGSSAEINAIIGQLEAYGARNADEIDRLRDYCGLCYSTKGEIDTNRIERVNANNMDVLIKQGEEIRKGAALIMDHQMQEVTQGHGRVLDVEFQEELRPGSERDAADAVGQRLIVNNRDGLQPSPPSEPRRAGRARKAA